MLKSRVISITTSTSCGADSTFNDSVEQSGVLQKTRPPSLFITGEKHVKFPPGSLPTPTIVQGVSSMNRAHIVISGGDGYVNWFQDDARDMKYEGICLMLWQCQI